MITAARSCLSFLAIPVFVMMVKGAELKSSDHFRKGTEALVHGSAVEK
jgi:hypothetical protein